MDEVRSRGHSARVIDGYVYIWRRVFSQTSYLFLSSAEISL